MYDVRPLNERFGSVVRPQPGTGLGDLDPGSIRKLLAESGAVLFEGFPADVATFASFSSHFGSPHSAHLHRSRDRDIVEVEGFDPGTLQTASYGAFGLNPHSEASYSPMRPDLIWFYCEVPARDRGRTTLCDGIDLLAALSEDARREFMACTLKWRWEVSVADLEDQLQLPFERLVAEWFDPDPRFTYRMSVDGKAIRYTFCVPATPETRLLGVPSFANSLLSLNSVYRRSNHAAVHYIAPEISGDALDEAMRLAHERCHPIDWQPGDFVLVDNTRVMHGREPFDDEERRILVQTMKATR